MEIATYLFKLVFKYPFKIAHTFRDHTLNAYILIKYDKYFGWGEAVFPPYMSENQETFKDFFESVKIPERPDEIELEKYVPQLHSENPKNTFAIAALDIALHNLKAQMNDEPIMKHYGINAKYMQSSFTLGISDKREMENKIKEVDASYFKLKVDEHEIGRIIKDYKSISGKPYVVDANQGFKSQEKALEWCEKLSEDKVAYLEQPFHKDDFESHKWLTERSPIPIIADESYQRIGGMDKISECFDGINVKLMKSGGVEEGQRALRKAKTLGLKTILGCMSESSVAVNAAWQLAPLADWVDLDGPLLIKNDPFQVAKSNEEIIKQLLALHNQ